MFFLMGCTPAMQQSWDATMHDVKTYNYRQILNTTGIPQSGILDFKPINNPQLRYDIRLDPASGLK